MEHVLAAQKFTGFCAGQARFAVSSLDKRKDKDGLFNYTDFYYQITCLIRKRKHREWLTLY
ncbi:hypothetical protein AZE42_14138 [Rhizopogon vesiculosus]|uniref:Uncharacterized protein n=1 Tax=Rhizopogon vesiculosus TaxID=180088 RepID=A0A1J8PUI3_9AGAM|nr:hypothetical protein AZE42_14138 [Rhizopogon vesiculosus]